MDTSLSYLDGNAAAGPLGDLLGFDITAATGRCASCGDHVELARCLLYASGPGMVLRCSSCSEVLVRLVVAQDRAWLSMSGLESMEIDRTDPGWS